MMKKTARRRQSFNHMSAILEQEKPQHWDHVVAYELDRALSKRSFFCRSLDEPVVTLGYRFDRSDLSTRLNWDLP